jgi:hypothetical protein
MTLLVRRRALLIFTILVVLITLAVALHGYVAMSAVAEGSLGAKLAAERVLFVSILAAMSTLSLGIALTVRAITLSAILDKLVNMNRMSGFSPELALERLGQVGEKINQLYRQASELSAKKSQKIGGLASLLQMRHGEFRPAVCGHQPGRRRSPCRRCAARTVRTRARGFHREAHRRADTRH